jgi:hypothetical protein
MNPGVSRLTININPARKIIAAPQRMTLCQAFILYTANAKLSYPERGLGLELALEE